MSDQQTELRAALVTWDLASEPLLTKRESDAIIEAARLVAGLLSPEQISEWVNSQPGVRADWFNPFHAQAVLLAVGMGDKDWVGMGDNTRPERERAAGSDGR